jgi:chromosome segregation ATPase
VAQAYGRAWVALDPDACPTSEQFARARRTEAATAAGPSLAALADAELDRIAEVARAAALAHRQKEASMAETQRLSETEDVLGHLQVAHEARSRRLATERMVFANHLHKAEAEIGRLKDEVARLREELAHAESRAAEAESGTRAEAAARLAVQEELSALRATRTFRYTAELRSVYGRLRQLGESPPKPTGSPADPLSPADPSPAADSPHPAETKPGP